MLKRIYLILIYNKIVITNLGKCIQPDARAIQNEVYKQYLSLLEKEIEIVNPKVIILFENQVSTVFLNEKISVSQCRKKEFIKKSMEKNINVILYFIQLVMGDLTLINL